MKSHGPMAWTQHCFAGVPPLPRPLPIPRKEQKVTLAHSIFPPPPPRLPGLHPSYVPGTGRNKRVSSCFLSVILLADPSLLITCKGEMETSLPPQDRDDGLSPLGVAL